MRTVLLRWKFYSTVRGPSTTPEPAARAFALDRRDKPEGIDAALRARGLRLTGPRRVVLDVVRATLSHPTAEWVHQMVRRRLPRVSPGSVYRNLRLLVAEGFVKEEYFELSMKLAEPLFNDIVWAKPDRVATDCPLAALQIHQGTGRTARHPIRILAEAYGLDAEDPT
jgi:Ferric uptake regulator family